MNIYQKKIKLRNKVYAFMFLGLFFFIFAVFGLVSLTTAGIIHLLLSGIGLAITLVLTYSILFQYYDELCDEIKYIENTIARNFGEDIVCEILETFDEEELNKVLTIAKEKEQEEDIKETNITNKKLKDIKERINHFELKKTKAICCC